MNDKILKFIDDFSYLWNPLYIPVLKHEAVINFISETGTASGKTPGESVLMLLSAVRFLANTSDNTDFMTKTDVFLKFLNLNSEILKQLFLNNTIQANFPERAFPVLEITGKIFKKEPVHVIELGASAGLIGRCLLNYKVISGDYSLFPEMQQYPENYGEISGYTGIEINPPSVEWLLACFADDADRFRIKKFISKTASVNNFKLIEGSAFDFPELVKNDILSGSNSVILTSFMMYQLNDDSRNRLVSLIGNYCSELNCSWINQMVEINSGESDYQYSVELNGEKIIRLADDKCSKWEWI